MSVVTSQSPTSSDPLGMFALTGPTPAVRIAPSDIPNRVGDRTLADH